MVARRSHSRGRGTEEHSKSRKQPARSSSQKRVPKTQVSEEANEQPTKGRKVDESAFKSKKAAAESEVSASSKKGEDKRSGFLQKLMIIPVLILLGAYFVDAFPANASMQTLDREALVAMVARSPVATADPLHPLINVTAVVTGATSGLGLATATELYGMGATVVLASRNAGKCRSVQQSIISEYPQSPGSLDCELTLDLADFDTVMTFVDGYKARYKHLSILINNAGMHYVSSPGLGALERLDVLQVSKQGYDLSWSSNYLGHFLLTKLLLPFMMASEKVTGLHGRIINVASSYHFGSDGTMLVPTSSSSMPEAARSDINTYTHRSRAYANSKLAQVLHAKELQKYLNIQGENNLKIQSVCPAWVNTGILPENIGGHFVGKYAFTPKAASLIPIGAVVKPELNGGEFVAIFQNWIASRSWSHSLFNKITSWGIRDAACNALSMFILATQGKTYGVHIQRSSPEFDDDAISKNLFDWSDGVLNKYLSDKDL
eukprot:GSChrysophyteH1.ASY1.ANO1.1539.1 assembled CDS